MKYLFRGLIIIGVMIMFGTAGASDSDFISIGATIVQILLSAILITGGYFGHKKFASQEKEYELQSLRFQAQRQKQNFEKQILAKVV